MRRAAADYPGRIVVGIDARDGKVAVEGWAETSEIGTVELARRFADAGVAAIVYTDIARDGALIGVDAAATAAFRARGRDSGDRLGRRRRRSPTSPRSRRTRRTASPASIMRPRAL